MTEEKFKQVKELHDKLADLHRNRASIMRYIDQKEQKKKGELIWHSSPLIIGNGTLISEHIEDQVIQFSLDLLDSEILKINDEITKL